tara:strand:- start:543 stop:1001 length:459 start_codon:yes stop_codon:yes gene_type:complete
MSTIVTPYLTKLNNIELELPMVAQRAVIENIENIKNILKYSQLELGINSDGDDVGVYSFNTENEALTSNTVKPKKAGDPFNFQWSGATFAFMDIRTDGKGNYDIFSTSGKQKLLEDIYGELFDLTDEHNQYVNIEIILPSLIDYILETLVKI